MTSAGEMTEQPTQDPNVRVYHTKFEMSDGPEVGTRGSTSELGAFGCLLLERRGIVQVHVTPYALLVTKGSLFTWDEVSPSVRDLLIEFALSQRLLDDDPRIDGPVRGIEESGLPGAEVFGAPPGAEGTVR